MRISVLLSAYKGDKYLEEQMDTIVNQTRIPDEIVIIDDCSNDDGKTQSVIDKYVLNYSYVKKYINSHNLGWAASFMNGIHLVSGDLVLFSDQDDIWDLRKIEIIEDIFIRNDINVLISDCIYTENVEPNIFEKNFGTGNLILDKYSFDNKFLNPKGVGAAMAVRKEFLEKYMDLWNPYVGHDRFYQIMAILFDKLCFLDRPLIVHRIHDSNTTGKKDFRIEPRICGLKGNLELINCLNKYNFLSILSDNENRVINDYVKFAKARMEMLENHSLIKWLLMPTHNLKYYPTRKTWFGDLKCIIYRR